MAMIASSRAPLEAGSSDSERSPFVRLNELLAPHQPGKPLITLAVGEPQHPVPDFVGPVLAKHIADFGRYPMNQGTEPFRKAASAWLSSRFKLPRPLDPAGEILVLNGSREGLFLAAITAARYVGPRPGKPAILMPNPFYPVYGAGARAAACEPVYLPTTVENGFLPDLDGIPEADSRRAGLLICGYPNNPTGAVADVAFFERLATWGLQRGVPICHDNAYAELTYDGIVAPSFLSAPSAREAGIEIYSLSKSLSMPGWRVAFAVGNAELIGRLRTLKTNVDAGMWLAMQHTVIRALEMVPSFTAGLRELYGRRRDLLCDGLDRLGLDFVRPTGALYVWVRVPGGGGSVAFAERLLEEVAVVVGPGAAYGPASDGYVRLSLTVADERLGEAVERIARVL